MALLGNVDDRRLGIGTVIRDNAETWSSRSGASRRRDVRRALSWYYGLPTLAAAPFLVVSFNIQGVGQLLAGVAVFTGLLFAMLILVFNTGITLRKDGDSLPNTPRLRRIVSDLRANITYAIFVAFALDATLIVAASTAPQTGGLDRWWAPPVIWLFVHLGLCLFAILRRFRTAFNLIGR
jgi:hypothetical protein